MNRWIAVAALLAFASCAGTTFFVAPRVIVHPDGRVEYAFDASVTRTATTATKTSSSGEGR